MDDLYRTIESVSTGLYKEKGSKFLSFAYHVESEEEVREILHHLKNKYFDARHFCYAYYLDPYREVYRINDDGEPSSTAGRPIQGQILSHDLTEILIVVVRYFGGIKLGVPGLINAYKSAAADAIANATVCEKTVRAFFDIEFDYLVMDRVMKLIKEMDIQVHSRKFENICNMKLSVRLSDSEHLKERLEKIETLSIK